MGLKVGDQVQVHFSGTIEEVTDRMAMGIKYIVRSESGRAHALYDRAEGEDFTVTRRDPENWPPVKGDVWASDKESWFARQDEDIFAKTYLYRATSGRGMELTEDVLRAFPEIRLVYRQF